MKPEGGYEGRGRGRGLEDPNTLVGAVYQELVLW